MAPLQMAQDGVWSRGMVGPRTAQKSTDLSGESVDWRESVMPYSQACASVRLSNRRSELVEGTLSGKRHPASAPYTILPITESGASRSSAAGATPRPAVVKCSPPPGWADPLAYVWCGPLQNNGDGKTRGNSGSAPRARGRGLRRIQARRQCKRPTSDQSANSRGWRSGLVCRARHAHAQVLALGRDPHLRIRFSIPRRLTMLRCVPDAPPQQRVSPNAS